MLNVHRLDLKMQVYFLMDPISNNFGPSDALLEGSMNIFTQGVSNMQSFRNRWDRALKSVCRPRRPA